MNPDVLQEVVDGIVAILHQHIAKIILYGSAARGTDTEESDVDIALLMVKPLDRDTEDLLSDFIVDMNLKYDKVFSVIDIDYEHFQKWKHILPFYKNVNQEGIVLWYAIIDIKDYEKTLATLNLLGELAKGKKSGEENGWSSPADVREDLKGKVRTVF